jgi:hypothetical protein
MKRTAFLGVLVVGLALVIAPFALSLPSKAGAGERMLGSFRPIMQPNQVRTTAYYYDRVFLPLGKVAPMMSAQNVARFKAYVAAFGGVQADASKLVPMLAAALHMTPAQVQAMLRKEVPSMAAMLDNLPQMSAAFGSFVGTMQQNTGVFAQVPAGLRHYEPLVRTMQANVGDYRQVDSLPSFRLFTWFFVVPGALLIALAGAGLLSGRTLPTFTFHHHARPTPA